MPNELLLCANWNLHHNCPAHSSNSSSQFHLVQNWASHHGEYLLGVVFLSKDFQIISSDPHPNSKNKVYIKGNGNLKWCGQGLAWLGSSSTIWLFSISDIIAVFSTFSGGAGVVNRLTLRISSSSSSKLVLACDSCWCCWWC